MRPPRVLSPLVHELLVQFGGHLKVDCNGHHGVFAAPAAATERHVRGGGVGRGPLQPYRTIARAINMPQCRNSEGAQHGLQVARGSGRGHRMHTTGCGSDPRVICGRPRTDGDVRIHMPQ